MKKFLLKLLTVVLVATSALFIGTACDKNSYSEGLAYALNYDGTSYIVYGRGSCTDTKIVIPETYEDKPVVEIGVDAFSSDSTITEVVIPNTVKAINSNAFYNCVNLKSVTIPSSVEYIDKYVFYNCDSLTSIVIPNSVESIGENTLADCDKLKTLTIGNSVESVGLYAFYNCPIEVASVPTYALGRLDEKTLKTLTITCGDAISSYALADFENLTSVTILDSVKTIGSYAFSECKKLSTIKLPTTIESIGQYAFDNCDSLINITLPDSLQTISSYAFSDCDSLTSIDIPDKVTNLGSNVFYSCDSLISVSIGDGVDDISQEVFTECAKLKNVDVSLNNEVYKSINGVVYSKDGKSLKLYPMGKDTADFTIPSEVEEIASYAFYNCSGLTSIVIPNTVTEIASYAFYNCNSLESITLPFVGASATGTNYTHFGYIFGASNYNYNSSYVPANLKTVTITDTSSISNYAFRNCSSIENIIVSESVLSIGNGAFYGCYSLESITLPFVGASATDTNYTHFGYIFGASNYSYNGSYVPTSLKKVIIKGGASIGDNTFYNCSNITSIQMPNSITSIGDGAFYGCDGLVSITIPSKVEKIGKDAFYSCDYLSGVTFKDTTTWYITTSSSYISGTTISVTYTYTNATNLKSIYSYYYWYKK